MSVLMAAGGTGGHLIPAVVVADALSKTVPSEDIYFAGTGKEIEKKILSSTSYSCVIIDARPMVGQSLIRLFGTVFSFFPSLIRTIAFLRSKKIKVVLGFGGYPSVLPVLAAFILRIPRLIFEQNGQAGVANKFLSCIATNVFAVPGSDLNAKDISYITNPVREELKETRPWKKPVPDERFCILVIGGSQGAVRVNSALLSMIPFLENSSVKVIHQTGAIDFERVNEAYKGSKINVEVSPYIEDMKRAYEEAHLVICRAGAGSVSEILTLKRPAIFIPLAISNGHQAHNIRALLEANAAYSIDQDEDLDKNLLSLVESLIENPEKLQVLVNSLGELKEAYGYREGTEVLTEAVVRFYEN